MTSNCGYLKNAVFRGPTAYLADLKARILQHIHSTLWSILEHAVYWYPLLVGNRGQHILDALHNLGIVNKRFYCCLFAASG